MQHISIGELPNEERPYEKFLKFGPASLTDTELVAILLQSGTKDASSLELARRVLTIGEEISVLALYRKPYEDLIAYPGIGAVKAMRLKCMAELSKRIHLAKRSTHEVFATPDAIAGHYMETMRHLDREQLIAVYLNGGCEMISDEIISIGNANHTLISAREIFMRALNTRAVYIMLVHNHPSGNATPSRDDILITGELKKAGEFLNIPLLDHVIIGDREYVSLKESGYL